MRINTQNYNDVTVIELQGELDNDVADGLKATITESIGAQRRRIILDMSNINFIDGQGLELLLWIHQYCRQNRVQLKLAGLDENCRKILEITRLKDEFDCHAELAGAVRSFA
jgi:anti-sigma B factor antagonist